MAQSSQNFYSEITPGSWRDEMSCVNSTFVSFWTMLANCVFILCWWLLCIINFLWGYFFISKIARVQDQQIYTKCTPGKPVELPGITLHAVCPLGTTRVTFLLNKSVSEKKTTKNRQTKKNWFLSCLIYSENKNNTKSHTDWWLFGLNY